MRRRSDKRNSSPKPQNTHFRHITHKEPTTGAAQFLQESTVCAHITLSTFSLFFLCNQESTGIEIKIFDWARNLRPNTACFTPTNQSSEVAHWQRVGVVGGKRTTGGEEAIATHSEPCTEKRSFGGSWIEMCELARHTAQKYLGQRELHFWSSPHFPTEAKFAICLSTQPVWVKLFPEWKLKHGWLGTPFHQLSCLKSWCSEKKCMLERLPVKFKEHPHLGEKIFISIQINFHYL